VKKEILNFSIFHERRTLYMRKTEKSVLYETSSLYVIGNTTYIVEIKFNDNSKETAEDVICDLIEREIESQKT